MAVELKREVALDLIKRVIPGNINFQPKAQDRYFAGDHFKNVKSEGNLVFIIPRSKSGFLVRINEKVRDGSTSINIPIIVACCYSECSFIESKTDAILLLGSTVKVSGSSKGFKKIIYFDEEKIKFTMENEDQHSDMIQKLIIEHTGTHYDPAKSISEQFN